MIEALLATALTSWGVTLLQVSPTEFQCTIHGIRTARGCIDLCKFGPDLLTALDSALSTAQSIDPDDYTSPPAIDLLALLGLIPPPAAATTFLRRI